MSSSHYSCFSPKVFPHLNIKNKTTINLGIVGGYFRLLPGVFFKRDADILHIFANSIPPISVMVCLVDSLSILNRFGDLNFGLVGSNPVLGFYLRDQPPAPPGGTGRGAPGAPRRSPRRNMLRPRRRREKLGSRNSNSTKKRGISK